MYAMTEKAPHATNKSGKRIVVAFLCLVIVLTVGLYIIYFQRVPLPAVAAHARVVPVIEAVPGLSVCWVETASRFAKLPVAATAGTILVRHPAGDLLIDAGNSSHFESEIQSLPFTTRLKIELLAGLLKTKVPLPELLRQFGEELGKVRWVILSHAHLDHAGGLVD